MTVYQTTLRVLSPIHIGDGDELRQDFDFVTRGNQTWRLNEDAILRAKESLLHPKPNGTYPTLGELLREEDYQNDQFFRYRLRGTPRSAKVDARVRSFIKDIHDCPYIPGSSLKGALRTALAWTGWDEVQPQLDRNAIGRSKSWAGQPLEHKLFGPNPNHDLLRALQVGDLSGPSAPGEGLVLVNAQVVTRRESGSPVELEALAGETSFHGRLAIDETLFTSWAESELHFGSRRHWLEELLPRLQRHSLARIRQLAEWFEQTEGCERLASFYRRLEAANIGKSAALVQLGWGAGWDGKTFWTHLQRDARLFSQLLEDFRMRRGRGSPRPGAPFPTSRRVAMVVKEHVARPAAPFGWALLELAPIS